MFAQYIRERAWSGRIAFTCYGEPFTRESFTPESGLIFNKSANWLIRPNRTRRKSLSKRQREIVVAPETLIRSLNELGIRYRFYYRKSPLTQRHASTSHIRAIPVGLKARSRF